MTAPQPVHAVKHAGALQCALSATAKACASYRMGLTWIGDDALLSASEMIAVAFPDGSPGALALALVLDAVESIGDAARFDAIDAARFDAIVSQLAGGAR